MGNTSYSRLAVFAAFPLHTLISFLLSHILPFWN